VAKPVVLIAEELSSATVEALGPDFEVRNCNGADRAELLAALAKGVDAVLIRSATKMDAEAIAAAKGLKVIARAGVGLDNVEIPEEDINNKLKMSISGDYEEFKTFKKSKKYKQLISNGVNVVFKPTRKEVKLKNEKIQESIEKKQWLK